MSGNGKTQSSLTDLPSELIPGMKAWQTDKGYTAVLLHFTADPEGPDERMRREEGSIDERGFQREHNLSFDSYAGKPVYESFNPDKHVTEEVFYAPGHPVWRGFDFGYHHPACVWLQVFGNEVWVHAAIMGEDMTLQQFVEDIVFPYQATLFPEDTKFQDAADVAGRQISDKSEFTSLAILASYGIFPITQKTEINKGLTILRQAFTQDRIHVHPRAKQLVEGFKGGYRYPEPTPGTPEPLFPLKDGYYEHCQDAFRYVIVNTLDLVKTPEKPKPKPEGEVARFIKSLNKPKRFMNEDLGFFS